jgi:hypothetical protein
MATSVRLPDTATATFSTWVRTAVAALHRQFDNGSSAPRTNRMAQQTPDELRVRNQTDEVSAYSFARQMPQSEAVSSRKSKYDARLRIYRDYASTTRSRTRTIAPEAPGVAKGLRVGNSVRSSPYA